MSITGELKRRIFTSRRRVDARSRDAWEFQRKSAPSQYDRNQAQETSDLRRIEA